MSLTETSPTGMDTRRAAQCAAVPILPSADLARSRACYAYLGFAVLDEVDDYLRLERGDIEVHIFLSPGHDPAANSAGCYLRVEDPDALRADWSADGVDCLEVPGSDRYGATLFAVIDPDGNTVRIGPLRRPALSE
jgi:catechol 2,3-dioxygenase-like lactoylglutathione lyase family enzyme